MKNRLIYCFITTLLLIPGIAGAEGEKPFMPLRFLSPELATQAVAAAVGDCTKRGYKVSAAVVDRAGNLAAFLRNPLSGPHTIKVAQRKAFSSATLQAPTSQMSSRADLSFAPGILLIVGGVPINVGGNFYGGVAVAGAEPKIDEECAQTGVDAITETLEFAD
ncbi:MAG: heme-binding protein [Rhodospirillales bacterium]|nr:heme-binding protein [Rhodospirillales bacterium]